MSKFFLVLLSLMGYTVFKAAQMWPNYRYAMSLVPALFAVMIGWMFLERFKPSLVNAPWFEAVVLVGTILMGVWATFIIFSIPADLIHLATWIFQKYAKTSYDQERRAMIFSTVRFSILGAAGLISVAGLVQTWLGPKIKRINIFSSKLPKQLQNLTIAQISDLHVGVNIRHGYTQHVVEQTNSLNPDLIFITGDMGDGKIVDLEKHLQPLSQLKSKYGIFYITGNHEYYWGVNDFTEKFKSFGMVPLINENKTIEINGSKLLIAGVTDPQGKMVPGHTPDLKKTSQNIDQADFKILLAHRPDTIIEAEPLGFDLQFSGHTHSGQYFPFNLLLPLAHKYYHGLNKHGNAQVYVNAGTGYWGPPNRFAISSEITLAVLQSA